MSRVMSVFGDFTNMEPENTPKRKRRNIYNPLNLRRNIYKPHNHHLGGGFKYFLFSPLPGEDSHFDSYFSDGLVQPPTRPLFLGIHGSLVLDSMSILWRIAPGPWRRCLGQFPKDGPGDERFWPGRGSYHNKLGLFFG